MSCKFCQEPSEQLNQAFGPWGTLTLWQGQSGKHYVDACAENQEGGEPSFEIHYCPMCGRKL